MSDAFLIIAPLSTIVIQLTVIVANVRSIRYLLAARTGQPSFDWRDHGYCAGE
jgi:hypothetical protein